MTRISSTLALNCLRLLLALSITAGTAALTTAQTCRVQCKTHKGTAPTYREVYEYDYVSDKPQFPGGNTQWLQYLNRTRRYPAAAYNRGIQGRVTVSFVVNTDGRISDIVVLRGVEESLNREAVRIVENMPHWIAGRHNGKSVPVRVIQTVPFRI